VKNLAATAWTWTTTATGCFESLRNLFCAEVEHGKTLSSNNDVLNLGNKAWVRQPQK
jgi:hypothetical protein